MRLKIREKGREKWTTVTTTTLSVGTAEEMEWEMRPGGMFVQRRAATEDNGAIYKVMMMTITVTHLSSHHDLFLPMNSTFC